MSRTIDDPWFQTLSGGIWYPYDPRPEDVRIEDLQALAHVNRFAGHTKVPYSVAEHCVWVAQEMLLAGESVAAALCGLIHDAHEAYPPGDVPSPVKRPGPRGSQHEAAAAGINWLEDMQAAAVRAHLLEPLGLKYEDHKPTVKKYDLIALATEKRDLKKHPPPQPWAPLPNPSARIIEPLQHPIMAWEKWKQAWVSLSGMVGLMGSGKSAAVDRATTTIVANAHTHAPSGSENSVIMGRDEHGDIDIEHHKSCSNKRFT